jgi:hypothetical protein
MVLILETLAKKKREIIVVPAVRVFCFGVALRI